MDFLMFSICCKSLYQTYIPTRQSPPIKVLNSVFFQAYMTHQPKQALKTKNNLINYSILTMKLYFLYTINYFYFVIFEVFLEIFWMPVLSLSNIPLKSEQPYDYCLANSSILQSPLLSKGSNTSGGHQSRLSLYLISTSISCG